MVKINVKKKEENVNYEVHDCLLLTHKNGKKSCLAIITEHCIDGKKRYDLTMFGKSDFRSASQWRVDDKYRTIEDLIKSVEKYHTITKLEEDQFEINIEVKL